MDKTLTIIVLTLSFLQTHASRPLDENEKWTDVKNMYTIVCDVEQTRRDYETIKEKYAALNKLINDHQSICKKCDEITQKNGLLVTMDPTCSVLLSVSESYDECSQEAEDVYRPWRQAQNRLIQIKNWSKVLGYVPSSKELESINPIKSKLENTIEKAPYIHWGLFADQDDSAQTQKDKPRIDGKEDIEKIWKALENYAQAYDKKQEETRLNDEKFKLIYEGRERRIQPCINFIKYFETRKAWWGPPPKAELNSTLSNIVSIYGADGEEKNATFVDLQAHKFKSSRSHPQNSNRLARIIEETTRFQTAFDKYYASWYPSVLWSWSRFINDLSSSSFISLFTEIEEDIDEILMVYNSHHARHPQSDWKQRR